LSRKKTRAKRKRSSAEIFGFLVLAVIVIAIIWLVLTSQQGPTQPPQTTGRTFAPDFALTDVSGNTFSLSDQRGKVVVLEFMRTTCPHCANEMSQLAAVHDQFGSDITMISVSVDPETDTTDVLKAYAAEHSAQWIWARDTANVTSEYQVSGVPTIIVIDSNGQIVQTNVGETSASTLIQQIQTAQH
jgi:cytochrome oxidase Cu insertion factor (SCO1/SenC/PrrC family)